VVLAEKLEKKTLKEGQGFGGVKREIKPRREGGGDICLSTKERKEYLKIPRLAARRKSEPARLAGPMGNHLWRILL